jgi:hypothetical protein
LTVGLPPALAGFSSLMVFQFPARFAELTGKRFTLLWRGARDGSTVRDFDGRCDGHANTLTFIEDTDGNIFGGFTPVKWKSRLLNGKPASENNFFKRRLSSSSRVHAVIIPAQCNRSCLSMKS